MPFLHNGLCDSCVAIKWFVTQVLTDCAFVMARLSPKVTRSYIEAFTAPFVRIEWARLTCGIRSAMPAHVTNDKLSKVALELARTKSHTFAFRFVRRRTGNRQLNSMQSGSRACKPQKQVRIPHRATTQQTEAGGIWGKPSPRRRYTYQGAQRNSCTPHAQ